MISSKTISVHDRPESKVISGKSVAYARGSSIGRSSRRRNDLDALRALAMLLGIVIHASLAYTTRGSYAVRDEQTHPCFDILSTAIHGFRMPLFFLISGYFTAMLWRERGLVVGLRQRASRILLPLAVFVLPNLWLNAKAISLFDAIDRKALASMKAAPDVLRATAPGNDGQALQRGLVSGADTEERDSRIQIPPSNQAALNGDDGTTERRPSTPPDNAEPGRSFVEWVKGFIEPNVKSRDVKSTRQAVKDLLKLEGGIPPAELGESGIAGGSSQEEFGPVTRAYLKFTADPIFSKFKILGHLWFLWFLCLLLIPFGIYAWVAGRLGWRGAFPALFRSPLLLLWLVPLTMIPQWFHGLTAPYFGPDTPFGIVPLPHILLLYAVFFFFGVFYFDCKDIEVKLGRHWWLMLPAALLIVYPLGMDLIFEPQSNWINRWIPPGAVRPLAVLLQAVYAWLMIFGLMGLFHHFFSSESKTVRYISDSAYFLYLMHVPLLFVPLYLMKWVHIPVVAKFAVACVSTTAILLLVYRYGVRYTFVGTMLNGKRRRPEKRNAAAH